MPEEIRNTYRYRILRYTPNLIRDEWVNIGVLLEEIPERADGTGHSEGPRHAVRLIEEASEIARVRRLHPKLRDFKFSASWGGPIAFTADTVPLLGRLPSCPNIIVSGAYAGHGVALSVRAGQLIARAIAEGAALPRWGALDRKPPRSQRWLR